MLDFRIDTFLALCETMNYREAAQRLNITQPAVTQHIQHLEQEYGCRLFLYEKRRLQKTDAGRRLEEYARAARHNEQQLREQLGTEQEKKLRIGATKTIGDYVIGQWLTDYLADESHSLELVVDNTEQLLHLLDQNKLDFALIEGYFDKNRFASRLLRKEAFVGICPKDHPFSGREVSMAELLGQTIIHREAGSGTRAILEQKLQSHNESFQGFRRRISISSFKLILEAVKAGHGLSFVYEVLADSDGELGKFSIEGEKILREFSIVYLKHTDPSDKIELFLGQKPLPE